MSFKIKKYRKLFSQKQSDNILTIAPSGIFTGVAGGFHHSPRKIVSLVILKHYVVKFYFDNFIIHISLPTPTKKKFSRKYAADRPNTLITVVRMKIKDLEESFKSGQ